MKNVFYIFCFLFILDTELRAQPLLQYSKKYSYPGTGSESGINIATDNMGNAYVTGITDANGNVDIVTVKYNAFGDTLWTRIYNGPGNGLDKPVKVITNGTKVYVTGYSLGSGTGYDFVTIAYNATNGTQDWVARYNDTNNGDDKASDIELDNAGNIYVSGTGYKLSNTTNSTIDGTIIKYNAVGTFIRQIIRGNNFDNASVRDIAINSSNQIFFPVDFYPQNNGMGGRIYILDTSFTEISGQWYLTNTPKVLRILPYGNSFYFLYADKTFNSMIFKVEVRLGSFLTDTWSTELVAANGKIAYGIDMALDVDGNPYAIYYDSSANVAPSVYKFLKLDGLTGDTLFVRSFNPSSGLDRPTDLKLGTQSTPTLYITGNATVSSKLQNYTVGYNSNTGAALWTLNQSCSATGNRGLFDLELDSYNNIYLTGYSDCDGDNDVRTVKYCASLPVADAGADKPVCQGSSVQIGSASLPNYIYSWSPTTGLNNANISNPLASPITNTTYILTVTSPSGCSSKDTVNVTVVPAPVANAGADQSVCSGSGVQIGVSPIAGNTYSWSPTSGLSNSGISNPITNNTSTQTYTLTVTNTANCTSTDQVVVTIKPLPNTILSVSPSNTVCSGDAVTLTASGASSYVWSPAGSGTTQVINPAATITYTVTGTTNGCDKSATQTITVKPVPNVATLTQRNDTLFSSVTVAGASYKWYKNGTLVSTTAVPNYKITSTGNYTLTITNNGCSSTSAIFVVSRVTGIRNSSSLINRIDLYPNPASQSLYIHILSGRSMNVQMHVLDIGGKEVLMKDVQVMKGENYQSIDVSKYTKGMYLIQINDEEGATVDKFLVE